MTATDESPEARLVRRTLAGEKEAYSLLVRRYQAYAYGVAVGLLSDFDLARDVVQEAFLCAYRNLPKLKRPSRFGGWLRGIVRHMAYRALRELERARALAEEMSRAAEPFARTPPPDEALEDAERREVVRRALGCLNEKNREAVSLYYVDGLSYADIAGFLDVTEATVQGRLQRARAKLRKELRMVEDVFKEKELPEDFPAEIRRLLDIAAARGEERERAMKRLSEIGAPAVDPLCEALGDSRVPVRIAAARALCTIGDARALRPILRLLYAGETANALYRSGRALAVPGVRAALVGLFREDEWKGEHYWAVRALSHARGDEEVYDCLLEVFRTRPHERGLVLAALCQLRPERALDLLTEALRGSDLRLRGSACWLAVRDGLLPPVGACLKAFGSGVGWWGRVCAGKLVLEHGKPGTDALERILRTGSSAARSTAAMALAGTGHEEALEVLKESVAGQRDKKWPKAVSRVLVRHYGGDVLAQVQADGRRLSRFPVIVWTLAKSRHAKGNPTVEQLFCEGTPTARAAAVRILARQKGIAFLPELRRCLNEGRPRKVAQEAFRQVLRLGDAAMPAVEAMLESDQWAERKAATCLLRRQGKLTPEKRTRAEGDPHVAVRHAAASIHSGGSAAGA